jgi:hypothetical protein
MKHLSEDCILYSTVHCKRQKGQTVSIKQTLLAWKMEYKPASFMAYNSILFVILLSALSSSRAVCVSSLPFSSFHL